MRLWKDIKEYPIINGWHTAPDGFKVKIGARAEIGAYVKIGARAEIGASAKIGDDAEIGASAEIGAYVKIGDDAKIGARAEIGAYVKIGARAEIGAYVKICARAEIGAYVKIGGAGFICVYLYGKWCLNPYAPGLVRLGCFTGTYSALRSRSAADWACHKYSSGQVELILKTLDYFEAIEHLVFVKPKSQEKAVKKGER